MSAFTAITRSATRPIARLRPSTTLPRTSLAVARRHESTQDGPSDGANAQRASPAKSSTSPVYASPHPHALSTTFPFLPALPEPLPETRITNAQPRFYGLGGVLAIVCGYYMLHSDKAPGSGQAKQKELRREGTVPPEQEYRDPRDSGAKTLEQKRAKEQGGST